MSNRFVDFAESKNAMEFNSLFEQTIASKISDALESKKIDLASSFFNEAKKPSEEWGEHEPKMKDSRNARRAARNLKRKMPTDEE